MEEGLITAKKINLAFMYNESMGFLVYAPRGWGKSAFKFNVGAEVLALSGEPPDWEAIKKWIIFTPREFCDVVLKTYDRHLVLLWDDAGFWLNRLFWYEPFVRETMRYMTLQRTQFAAILFSTPSLAFLPGKLIELEDVYRVKIYKASANGPRSNFEAPLKRPRLAWVKRPWYSDDLKKHGVRTVWRDHFSAMMPDSFYNWYQPLRDKYLRMAAERIREAVEKTQSKVQKDRLDKVETEIGDTIPDPDKVSEMKEVVAQLQT